MKLVKATDKIKLTHNGVSVVVSPLSYEARIEVMDAAGIKGGNTTLNYFQHTVLTLKHSVKSIEGVENVDGTPYVLELDPSGKITNESAAELSQFLSQIPVMLPAISKVASYSMPNEEGVEVELVEGQGKNA